MGGDKEMDNKEDLVLQEEKQRIYKEIEDSCKSGITHLNFRIFPGLINPDIDEKRRAISAELAAKYKDLIYCIYNDHVGLPDYNGIYTDITYIVFHKKSQIEEEKQRIYAEIEKSRNNKDAYLNFQIFPDLNNLDIEEKRRIISAELTTKYKNLIYWFNLISFELIPECGMSKNNTFVIFHNPIDYSHPSMHSIIDCERQNISSIINNAEKNGLIHIDFKISIARHLLSAELAKKYEYLAFYYDESIKSVQFIPENGIHEDVIFIVLIYSNIIKTANIVQIDYSSFMNIYNLIDSERQRINEIIQYDIDKGNKESYFTILFQNNNDDSAKIVRKVLTAEYTAKYVMKYYNNEVLSQVPKEGIDLNIHYQITLPGSITKIVEDEKQRLKTLLADKQEVIFEIFPGQNDEIHLKARKLITAGLIDNSLEYYSDQTNLRFVTKDGIYEDVTFIAYRKNHTVFQCNIQKEVIAERQRLNSLIANYKPCIFRIFEGKNDDIYQQARRLLSEELAAKHELKFCIGCNQHNLPKDGTIQDYIFVIDHEEYLDYNTYSCELKYLTNLIEKAKSDNLPFVKFYIFEGKDSKLARNLRLQIISEVAKYGNFMHNGKPEEDQLFTIIFMLNEHILNVINPERYRLKTLLANEKCQIKFEILCKYEDMVSRQARKILSSELAAEYDIRYYYDPKTSCPVPKEGISEHALFVINEYQDDCGRIWNTEDELAKLIKFIENAKSKGELSIKFYILKGKDSEIAKKARLQIASKLADYGTIIYNGKDEDQLFTIIFNNDLQNIINPEMERIEKLISDAKNNSYGHVTFYILYSHNITYDQDCIKYNQARKFISAELAKKYGNLTCNDKLISDGTETFGAFKIYLSNHFIECELARIEKFISDGRHDGANSIKFKIFNNCNDQNHKDYRITTTIQLKNKYDKFYYTNPYQSYYCNINPVPTNGVDYDTEYIIVI